MPLENGDDGKAQAIEAATRKLRKQVTEARDVIWLLRAHIARSGVEFEDDKRVLTWLTTEATSEK